MSSAISSFRVFDADAVAASGTLLSEIIDLARYSTEGFFSLQVALTGTGTGKCEFLVSNDGVTFIEPTGATDVFSGLTVAGGPGGDGKDIFSFSPPVARFIRLKLTETGGANGITVTAWIAIQ